MDPYRPPRADTVDPPEPVAKPKPKSNLRSLVLPTVGGAIAGSFFLAPITQGVGDPSGRGIGAGVGGLMALYCAIVIRSIWRVHRGNASG